MVRLAPRICTHINVMMLLFRSQFWKCCGISRGREGLHCPPTYSTEMRPDNSNINNINNVAQKNVETPRRVLRKRRVPRQPARIPQPPTAPATTPSS
ncbi:hypothetical protein HBI40_161360 [Parastagonospora nodorum]|nr:hypothetical protein HBH50_201110 [Parastagonospora nodorum]KAH4081504.1 hypothetical protein HBH48_196760 [Parastagonospora nodorum]KAH4735891.1 hypothetical protein HBH65_233260 [Parastagonospora nodorum]KAH5789015.1 hypothetical protein HBI96_219090 [Parastagonospora nodorum]KAH5927179.1 hypothetical protein HBI87_206580 [Parastagonospora nodorum]